ncbi:MAG: serine hydrolase [Phycisphaerales bacterium]
MDRIENVSRVACLVVALLVSGAANAADRFTEICEKHAKILVDAGMTPGLVVGILVDGEREYHGFGVYTEGDGRVPDERTIFEIGSITKTFTATLLAEAQVRGELAIDDPLGEHLPEGIEPPMRDGAQPTIGQLSDHTSGFAALPTNFGMTSMDDPYAEYNEEKLWAFVDGHRLGRAPGEWYVYSNLAAGLLGTIVSRAADSTFGELVAARITGPLGMRDTIERLDDEQSARFAPPHHAGGAPATTWHFDALAGAGSLRSTAADMLTWAEAQIDPGATPLAGSIPLTHTPRAPLPDSPAKIALGWHVAGDGSTLFHSGGTNGYRTALFVNPEHGVAVIVLANATEERVSAVSEKIIQAVFGLDPQPVPVEPAVVLDAAQLGRLAGKYGHGALGMYVVTVEDGKVMAKLGPQPAFEIVPASESEFFYMVVDAQLEFDLDGESPASAVTLFQSGAEFRFERLDD